jgi:hypothetical protein
LRRAATKTTRRFSNQVKQLVTEEMKAWAAALAGEVETWPQVRSRVFFGFTALYRTDVMFALLPRTRTLDPPNSVAFKLEAAGPCVLAQARRDPRIGSGEMRKARWFTFALSAEVDLRDALQWLMRAHQVAT